MFTGIIEDIGKVQRIEKEGSNLHFFIESKLGPALKIDQSLSHNGACLTVVSLNDQIYQVTAVDETLQKTNLSSLQEGDLVNLERSMVMNARIDGHLVQGHVDQLAQCSHREDRDGSWIFSFEYDPQSGHLTVEKGSICINGVSLTVIDSKNNGFSVAIIPYTYEHTNFKNIQIGDQVNLEFDIIGKYIEKYLSQQNRSA